LAHHVVLSDLSWKAVLQMLGCFSKHLNNSLYGRRSRNYVSPTNITKIRLQLSQITSLDSNENKLDNDK
jgi:hypothetical protein